MIGETRQRKRRKDRERGGQGQIEIDDHKNTQESQIDQKRVRQNKTRMDSRLIVLLEHNVCA
jgi:hypothetical protein